jgi:hypothetical protein
MEWSKGFKLVWWLLLISGLTYVLSTRFSAFATGTPNAVDAILLVVWLCLLIAPLFHEVSLFGLTLKQQMKELKEDVNKSIQSVSADIVSKIQVCTQIAPHFYLNFLPPPSDAALSKIKESAQRAVQEVLDVRGIVAPVADETEKESPIPLCHSLEKALREAFKLRFKQPETLRPLTVMQLAWALTEVGLLSHNLFDAIRDVYSVCSPAIRGESVSDEQIRFVSDVAPGLIAAVKNIQVSIGTSSSGPATPAAQPQR